MRSAGALLFFLFVCFQPRARAVDSTTWLSGTFSDFYSQNGLYGQKYGDIFELNTHQNGDGSAGFSFDSQLDLRLDAAAIAPQDRFLLEPEEFRVRWHRGEHQISFGFHREIWEGTDFLNPMGLATMKNEQNPLDPRDRGSAGVYWTFTPARVPGMTFDFLYVPYQALPLVPSAQSYWWPRQYNLPLQSNETILLLPSEIGYQIDSASVFNRALNNNVGLHVSESFDMLDLSAAYFEGANSTPTLSPVLNATLVSLQPQTLLLRSPVEVRPEVYRVRRAALAMSWTNSWFIAKIAAQWNRPLGDLTTQVGTSRVAVLELEKALSFAGQDLNLIAEWIETQQADNSDLVLLSALLKRGASLGWRWAFDERFTWYLGYYQEVTRESHFLTNRVSWKWNDQWTAEVSVEQFGGPKDSPLGVYQNNSQAAFSIKYFVP